MATKLKDYYNLRYCQSLADKLQTASLDFDRQRFLALVEPTLDQLEFNNRQILITEALKACLPEDYVKALAIFYQILGPELPGSLGMFTEGWWLWPIGKYVELFGADQFELSTAFSKELTKRFTGEFCMRPLLANFPEQTIKLMVSWSQDENRRVRRLASECLRIRLPWAKKNYAVLDYFDDYQTVLTNLRDESDKTIQKSVANNLNDLCKEAPDKFKLIIDNWQQQEITPACAWIIKHGSRSQTKARL